MHKYKLMSRDVSLFFAFKQTTMKITIIIILTCLSCAVCFSEEPSVMGKIKAGFKMAGKFLGLDKPNRIAELVSQTFGGKPKRRATNETNIFSGFLRLLGLDSRKLSAIAVNAIIFVAQLISTTLSKPSISEGRKLNEGTVLDWMMSNSRVNELLSDAKDSNLPNAIVEAIKEKGLDESTDCIQMLMCKSAPLIWGMQKNINGSVKFKSNDHTSMFESLPTVEEFSEHADLCEEKHPYCLIYY